MMRDAAGHARAASRPGGPFAALGAPRGCRDFVVFGVPSDGGNGVGAGARGGPAAIRAAADELSGYGGAAPSRAGCGPADAGDVGIGARGSVPATMRAVGRMTDGIARQGGIPIMLGGDHAFSFASVDALARRGPLHVVWFDAHTDFSPGWTSGNDHKQVLRRIAALPDVSGITLIGIRGFAYYDEVAACPKVDVVRARDARLLDDGSLGAEILAARVPADASVYVSIDIDVLDPGIAPGTATPVPGGLSLGLVANATAALCRGRRLRGLDVMEVSPSADRTGRTAAAAAHLIATALRAVPDDPDPQGSKGGASREGSTANVLS